MRNAVGIVTGVTKWCQMFINDIYFFLQRIGYDFKFNEIEGSIGKRCQLRLMVRKKLTVSIMNVCVSVKPIFTEGRNKISKRHGGVEDAYPIVQITTLESGCQSSLHAHAAASFR